MEMTRRQAIMFFLTWICLGLVLNIFSARAEETVKFASIYAHSGPAAKSNAPSITGVRFGITEVNSRGGVLGKKIELIEIDNISTPIGSKVAADKAVKLNVTAIIGAAWSSHSIAVARVAQANQIPMISDASTNIKVTRIGDYIFRACYTDPFQGLIMAQFARKDLHAATAVTFVDLTSDYSIGLAHEFRKNFEKLGGRILLEAPYKHKQESFEGPVLKAKQVRPDVLFIPGHDESALIIKAAIKAGMTAVPIGGDGWGDEHFFLAGGKEIKKGYYGTHWSEDIKTEPSQYFVKKYLKTQYIHTATALGYDAVLLMADAIERAGTTERSKIREALAKTENFQGVTGSISFNPHGDPTKSAVIMEITGGRRHFLKRIEPD